VRAEQRSRLAPGRPKSGLTVDSALDQDREAHKSGPDLIAFNHNILKAQSWASLRIASYYVKETKWFSWYPSAKMRALNGSPWERATTKRGGGSI